MIGGMVAILALISLGLTVWQWLEARRFPLHQRLPAPPAAPNLTLLKPLKGGDAHTESCLRSWMAQEYPGALQIIFAVDAADDPVVAIVRKLQAEFPQRPAQLVVCTDHVGANGKAAKLATVEKLAQHDVIAVSDADMFVPPDFLHQSVTHLANPDIAMVTHLYRLATPGTLAHRCEAVAINADFWSQVLQARALGPLDFALGAVMVMRRERLTGIGGFRALAECLADDYQLGRRIFLQGGQIVLGSLVAECRESPQGWHAVWRHQLRWARTIRVCAPGRYFASILGNGSLWCGLCLLTTPGLIGGVLGGVGLLLRTAVAVDLQRRITQSTSAIRWWWLVPVKDLLQTALWIGAFTGNGVIWRGESLRLHRGGKVVSADTAARSKKN